MKDYSEENREMAIRLAGRYKQIERELSGASAAQKDKLRQEAANIAAQMFELGYSLGQLILKRQKRKGVK